MPKNRVEKLESTVAELESTVEGLTEELVESKERIRVLETALDTEPPTRVPERRVEETQETPSFEAAPDDVEAAAADAEADDESAESEEPQESRTDDIIVA